MKKIGYARVSSYEQNLGRQLSSLKDNGVDEIFCEKISGKNLDRPELNKLINKIKEQDEIVVSSLDRLGRNSNDIKWIMQQIKSKKATLTILDLPSFRGVENENLRELLNSLIIDLFSYVAENERENILKRQKQGIEIAKKEGKYKGRKEKFTLESKELQGAIKMYHDKNNKKYTMDFIARTNGMSKVTFYRKIKQYNL